VLHGDTRRRGPVKKKGSWVGGKKKLQSWGTDVIATFYGARKIQEKGRAVERKAVSGGRREKERFKNFCLPLVENSPQEVFRKVSKLKKKKRIDYY